MSKNVLILLNNTIETAGCFEKILIDKDINYKVIDLEKNEPLPDSFDFTHLIVMGGHSSVYDGSEQMMRELAFIKKVIARNIPYFGVCLGMQLLAYALGADVKRCEKGEYGFGDGFICEIVESDHIFDGFKSDRFAVFQLHGDCVVLNEELKLIAKGNGYPVQFIKHKDRFYGIQSHVEIERDKFEVWMDSDPSLLKLDRDREFARFGELECEMGESAILLMENFLKL